MARIRPLAMTWLSSLVIALSATSVRADGDRDDGSPWVDQGGVLPLPASTSAVAVPDPEPSSRRKWGSLAGVVGVYTAASTYMYFAWYYNQPNLPDFKFGGDGYFGENTYAGGVDKLGHAWANLMWSRLTSSILLWGGWTPWKAGVIASSMTLALFTLVEVKDGFYYEFSPGDAIANTLGAGLNAAMVAFPRFDELFDFRVEYFPSREYLDLVAGKHPPPDPDHPHQVSLNIVEDYSGQRYLLALHLGALPGLRGRTWARLVDVAVGYETDKYKPDPIDPAARRSEHLFVGLSFNMQGLIDTTLSGRRGRVARMGHSVGHLVFEVFNPPFASAAVLGATRSPD